jgi:putative addiction module component (TIGR02574 family)
MTATLLEEARALPAPERLQFIDELGASLVDEERVPALPLAQAAELERRLAAHCAASKDVVTWEQMQSELAAKQAGSHETGGGHGRFPRQS